MRYNLHRRSSTISYPLLLYNRINRYILYLKREKREQINKLLKIKAEVL